MSAVKITLEEAREVFNELVAEKGPEYRFRTRDDHRKCQYFDIDPESTELGLLAYTVPACIVGHVLARKGLGPESEDFKYWNDGANVQDLADGPRGAAAPVIEVDHKTLRYLERAQERQDSYDTWADAVKAAELLVSEPTEVVYH